MKATGRRQSSVGANDDLPRALSKHAPRAFRIAIAFTADRESAFSVVDVVFRAAVRRDLSRMNDTDAARWFNHYTVLVSRRFPPQMPRAQIPPEFLPLMEALHRLPRQQLEAFVLRHGEEMDLRQIATAMDCSASAAANHLVAGVEKMRAVSDGRLGEFTARLPVILNAMLPPANELDLWVGGRIGRAIRRNRRTAMLRWIAMILTTAVVVGIGWVIWRMIQI